MKTQNIHPDYERAIEVEQAAEYARDVAAKEMSAAERAWGVLVANPALDYTSPEVVAAKALRMATKTVWREAVEAHVEARNARSVVYLKTRRND